MQGIKGVKLAARMKAAFWGSETAVMLIMAAIIGGGAGLGTLGFIWLIDFFKHIFFDGGADILGFLGRHYVIVIPAIGGLLVGPIVYFLAPEARGHGVPEVMAAIATRGGRIRPVVVLAKTLGSALTIGSGGSVGREGPIVQIGSALGSTIGQRFHLSERRLVNLIACGAAGGIAATFNAPIGGVMFALEVILGEFTIRTFSSIVIAAVSASVVSRAALGGFPAFVVPEYSLVSPWELLLYLGLGVAAAVAAHVFVRVLYRAESIFESWRFPPYLKPAAGGLLLGVLGFFIPQIFGTGFESIESALRSALDLRILLVLIGAKILATSLTLGSGGSGGVFAPALFIGAVLGGAYGEAAGMLFPEVTAASGAYATVGMAAVFAAAARAPITSVLILFEMTQDYRIILPLMFATVVSTLIAGRFESESIYSLKLKHRGIDMHAGKDLNLMRAIRVSDAMTPLSELVTVNPQMPIKRLAPLFRRTRYHGFPVVEGDRLFGVVTISDLENALERNIVGGAVEDIATKRVITAYPDETLEDVLRNFGAMDVGRIPVVDRSDPQRIVGMLRRVDIIRSYSRSLRDWRQRKRHLDSLQIKDATSAHTVQLEILPTFAAVGKPLRDLELPKDMVIVSVRRAGQLIVPRGDTRLEGGDQIVAVAPEEREKELIRRLKNGN
jgi:CIC family chloride channel protein